jgi:hypothetical protein
MSAKKKRTTAQELWSVFVIVVPATLVWHLLPPGLRIGVERLADLAPTPSSSWSAPSAWLFLRPTASGGGAQAFRR